MILRKVYGVHNMAFFIIIPTPPALLTLSSYYRVLTTVPN